VYESDRELIQRMLNGEESALAAFFDLYAPKLAAFATRRASFPAATIEDIVQTTLVKALRNLSRFRGDSAVYTWLCGICSKEIINSHRAIARRGETVTMSEATEQLEPVLWIRAEELDPASEIETAEHRRAVAHTLNQLPANYARALELKYGDGFSVDDIARTLGVTTIAAQSLLARARLAFKKCWAERYAA
jgi:RNA polymerase sigma-70 factor (ECF subfamily)